MVHMCKMIISPGVFFIWKMVQNDKKFSLSSSISQEPYIIWYSFMVHKCKRIISPGSFFIFSKCGFYGLLVGKREDKKFCLSHSISQESCIISYFMVHMCKMIISPCIFLLFFQNFNFLGWQICLLHWKHALYDCDFW